MMNEHSAFGMVAQINRLRANNGADTPVLIYPAEDKAVLPFVKGPSNLYTDLPSIYYYLGNQATPIADKAQLPQYWSGEHVCAIICRQKDVPELDIPAAVAREDTYTADKLVLLVLAPGKPVKVELHDK